MAAIDSRVARIWVSSARSIAPGLRSWGYHTPYKPAKRAVVSGSFTGVKRLTHG